MTEEQKLIAEVLAGFAAQLRYEDIPRDVRDCAKYLILDAVGIAFASTRQPYADAALAGLAEFGSGPGIVIGMAERLSVRDAIVMNGVLVHGLDYDDTHPEGVIHSTASCFPCALGIGSHLNASGRDVLTAFVVGTEVAARLGMVARGALHEAGFHPTGMFAAFASALITGRLYGLTPEQMVMAQGIALSTGSSSSRQFNREGAGSKRLHPGWGAAAGVAAAALAKHGFTGPRAAYEGDYGLYPSHLGTRYEACDLSVASRDLAVTWETLNVAIKPIPACLHVHASTDAAAAIATRHAINAADIDSVRVLVPREAVAIVCEPADMRRRPASSYAAQFSLPYAVASGLVRKRLSMRELEPDAINDPEVLAVAEKVQYAIDPDSGYPRYFSGEVIVQTKDGRELRHREHINRGSPDRPLTADEIVRKFRDNAELATTQTHASAILEAVLSLDSQARVNRFAELLAGRSI
ncbi:MAG: MmgE/PrpD family protein [Steroidobacteraceae bacterium]